MDVRVKDIIGLMEAWAPPDLAEHWDHPGLQVGDPEAKVSAVVTALDLTEENIALAEARGASLIVSHHPFLFRPLKEINLSTAKGKIIATLLAKHITSFAAHTNLDTAEGGVNDALADALGLTDRAGLVPVTERKAYKAAVYVDVSAARAVEKRLEEIGGCDHFYLLDDDNDFTPEGKLEFNIAPGSVGAVKDFLKGEGLRYDLYELANHGRQEMMGRVGNLPKEMTGEEALAYIKEKLGIYDLRYSGDAKKTVRRVAVLGGAGAEFLPLAAATGADLYLTGDVKYHEVQEAARMGIILADGGHFFTERVVVPVIAAYLREECEKRGWKVEIIEDSGAEDFFRHV